MKPLQSRRFSPSARRASPLAGLALAAGIAGCSPQYEIDRPGTWKPTGANDANLQAMVANPLDLQTGESVATDRANGAARAVTRLLTDRRRQLLNVAISRVVPASDSGGDSPADTPSPGAAGAASGSQ